LGGVGGVGVDYTYRHGAKLSLSAGNLSPTPLTVALGGRHSRMLLTVKHPGVTNKYYAGR